MLLLHTGSDQWIIIAIPIKRNNIERKRAVILNEWTKKGRWIQNIFKSISFCQLYAWLRDRACVCGVFVEKKFSYRWKVVISWKKLFAHTRAHRWLGLGDGQNLIIQVSEKLRLVNASTVGDWNWTEKAMFIWLKSQTCCVLCPICIGFLFMDLES